MTEILLSRPGNSGRQVARWLAAMLGHFPLVAIPLNAQVPVLPLLVIEGGTLIDGNGGAPVPDSLIIIRGTSSAIETPSQSLNQNQQDKNMSAETNKGYWIANVDVSDMEGLQRYRDANREVMNRFGAKFIVMHGQQEVPEGTSRSKQTLVEFPSYQAAVDCYHHPDYQKAAEIRHEVSEGSMVMVEGYSDTQDF